MKWITTKQALIVSGYKSRTSLRLFIRKFNEKHPDNPVIKLHGKVEEESLLEALKLHSMS